MMPVPVPASSGTDDWSSAAFDFPPRPPSHLLSPKAPSSTTASKRASFDRSRTAFGAYDTRIPMGGNEVEPRTQGSGLAPTTATGASGTGGTSSRRGSTSSMASSSHLASSTSSTASSSSHQHHQNVHQHGRMQSLTSACPPVTAPWATASPSPSPLRSDTLALPSVGGHGLGLLGPTTTLSRSPSPAPTTTSTSGAGQSTRRLSLNSSTSSTASTAHPPRSRPSPLQLAPLPLPPSDLLFSTSPVLGSALTLSSSPTVTSSSTALALNPVLVPARSPRSSPLLGGVGIGANGVGGGDGSVSPGLGLLALGEGGVTPRRTTHFKGGFGWGIHHDPAGGAGVGPNGEGPSSGTGLGLNGASGLDQAAALDGVPATGGPSLVGAGTGGPSPPGSSEKRKLTLVIPASPRSIRTKYRPHAVASRGGVVKRVGEGLVRYGVGWPVAVLHGLLGPFAHLTISVPIEHPPPSAATSTTATGAPTLGAGPASNPSSPALGGSFKKRRTNGGPTPWVLRLLGMAYVLLSVVLFGRSCAHYLSGRSTASLEAEASKVRRTEAALKEKQMVFAGLAPGIQWVEGWEKKARQKLEGWITTGTSAGGAGSQETEWGEVEKESNVPEGWDMEGSVRRKWGEGALTATTNPLSPFSHGYRLAKMHGKLSPAFADQVEPYLFSAAGGPPALGKGEVTACMYTNDLWGSEVAEFVRRWGGPVSLVWETTAPRTAGDEGAKKARQDTIRRIAKLRDSDSLFRALVDVHLVAAPRMPGPIARRKREKMLTEPVATNHQLNIGRFFARTSVVWLVGDARIVPSHNLRVKLNGEALKRQVLEHGDALVVPTFGFIRPDNALKSFESFNANGSSADATFAEQARQYVAAHRTSISIPSERWPKTKRSLVTLTTRPSTTEPSSSDSGPLLGMHDESWDVGKGPTNWVLWRKYATDPRLAEGPELGGGAGLGVEGRIGGGSALYRVTAYDLHYAPNVVVSRQGQPWCTERFEDNKAACAYQMYLTGTELWVVPDEWAFTLKVLGSTPSTPTEAERLKNSISNRLYTKFHQEACMHYGREFLSVGAWDSERARHLRAMCSKVLNSWGVGVSEPPDGGADE